MNEPRPDKKLKLAIIGCGAVTRSFHIRAATSSPFAEVVVLVDRDLQRARELADAYKVPDVADDYRTVAGKVDAAIIALPHHLHAPAATFLLTSGVHVLIEKPMALRKQECDDIARAAQGGGAILEVGLLRRFYPSSQFVKRLLQLETLGQIQAFDLREGFVYGWKVTSDFMFRREAGGGVLADSGAHTLDLLLWWFGDLNLDAYRDDARGGVEANCELELSLNSGTRGFVELSRTRNLRNTCIIRGTRGTLELSTVDFDPVIRLSIGNGLAFEGRVQEQRERVQSVLQFFERQLHDFLCSIVEHRKPFVPASEGRRSVDLIESCYGLRTPLKLPWTDVQPVSMLGKAGSYAN